MTTKEAMVRAIQELPEGASIDEAIERLFMLQRIERSIDQIKLGKTLSNDEVMKRIEKWLS
jgi:hypothetical protein